MSKALLFIKTFLIFAFVSIFIGCIFMGIELKPLQAIIIYPSLIGIVTFGFIDIIKENNFDNTFNIVSITGYIIMIFIILRGMLDPNIVVINLVDYLYDTQKLLFIESNLYYLSFITGLLFCYRLTYIESNKKVVKKVKQKINNSKSK